MVGRKREGLSEKPETVPEKMQAIRRDMESPALSENFTVIPQPDSEPASEETSASATEPKVELFAPCIAPPVQKSDAKEAPEDVFVLTEMVKPAGGLLLDPGELEIIVARRTRREVRRWLESNLPRIVRELVSREGQDRADDRS